MMFSWKYIVILLSWNRHIVFSYGFDISKEQLASTIDIPDGLLFGAGTSAFQIEGASKSHGRSESYFEWFLTQSQRPILDSPDVSSDSYHRYKEDVEILKYIGLDIYRFSMSWTRLLPTGYADHVNQEGVDYYHALLDELERAGIEPMVQLHHFDHPAVFEEFGGWQNESMVELFKDYAGFVFEEFGHRIKYFLTFNEPNAMCHLLDSGLLVNREEKIKSMFPKAYICSHNLLKAHAEAYHLYHNEFNLDNKGKISMNLLCNDYIVEGEKDSQLTDVAFAFGCGWFANPIYSKSGDYSDILKERAIETNALRGYENLQLPIFSETWIKKIRGSADFFGLTYYTSRIVEPAAINDPESWVNLFVPPEARLLIKTDPTWVRTPNDNYIVAAGLRSMLKKIKKQYNNPSVHIVENGYSDRGWLNDTDRIKFIYSHVREAIDAINDDKCDVKSYIYWSLIDNFEFWAGFSLRFGFAHIDFNSPNRTRTPKESATWFRNVLLTRKLYIEE